MACDILQPPWYAVAGVAKFLGAFLHCCFGPVGPEEPLMFNSNPVVQPDGGLPADFSMVLPSGESIRHILLGRPSAIRQTIHLLHNLRYVETSLWSPLIEIPDNRLILTPDNGDVLSMLVRRM